MLKIVSKIKEMLNIGDEGKISNFINKVIKKLTRDLHLQEKNLDTLKFNHSQILDRLGEKLEDVKQAFEDAYTNVQLSQISTSQDQDSYVENYLTGIETNYVAVQKVESEIKQAIEEFNTEQERIKDQITTIQFHLKKLSEKS